MSSIDSGGDSTAMSSAVESSPSVPSNLTVSTESESTHHGNGTTAQFTPTTPSSARARRKERKRLEQQSQKDSPRAAASSASGAPAAAPSSAFSPVGSNSNASIQLIKPVASLPGTRSTPPIAPSSSSHSPHPSASQNGDLFYSQAAPAPPAAAAAPAPAPPAAVAAPVPAAAPVAAAAPPNPVSQFVSPFDNPSLNFMWPVFSPSPAAPAVVEASPPAPMPPTHVQSHHHTPAVVNSIPIMTAPPAVVALSPSAASYHHQPQQNHTPHHHQQPYASPTYSSPSPAAAYASPQAASPGYYSSPVPPMPSISHMTPEQTAYMQAGWAQAQYFFAQQQQAAQQPHGYAAPAAQNMSHQSYTPPPHANGAYYAPSAASPPTGGSMNGYDPSRSAPPAALPTGPYVAPSFAPISAAASPALPSSNSSFNPSTAPPGLMVLTPNAHQPNSAHSSGSKLHYNKKKDSSSSSADESSDSEDDGRRSRHRSKGSRSNSSATNHHSSNYTSTLAPPLPHRRAVTDPASPKRAQRGVKPSSFPFPNPHDLSVETHSRGPSNPASATSTPSLGSANGEKKKLPRWKILSPEQEDRERRRNELILTERPISNRGIERHNLDSPSSATLPPPSFGGLTPPIGKSELTRRSPSKRSSASSTPTPSGSKRDKKSSRGLKDSKSSSDALREDDSKTKRRSVMIGALQNPNSDLEVSVFLTLVFVVVAAFCVLFLLR